MKPELLEILCCPVCRSELTLTATRTEGTEIVQGSLRCGRCAVDYPIDDGIPDLLPPDERDPPAVPPSARKADRPRPSRRA